VEAFFKTSDWYNVFILRKPEGTEWYCNVASPPLLDAGKDEVRFVDYDLDVYVYADKSYKVLDRDEFEENARKMGYPEETRRMAEQGLQAIIRAIEEGRAPFDE
jgi:protein associated with RNAse G/E